MDLLQGDTSGSFWDIWDIHACPPIPGQVGHLARMAFLPESHISGRAGVGGRGGRAWLPWSTAQSGGCLWGGGDHHPGSAGSEGSEVGTLLGPQTGSPQCSCQCPRVKGQVQTYCTRPPILSQPSATLRHDRRSRIQAPGPGKPPL